MVSYLSKQPVQFLLFLMYGSLSSLLQMSYFYAVPGRLQKYCRSRSTLRIGLSLWVVFGSIQIHHILNNERRDHMLPPLLVLSTPRRQLTALVHVFNYSVSGTRRFLAAHQCPLWRPFCLEFTVRCPQATPHLRPTPAWPAS